MRKSFVILLLSCCLGQVLWAQDLSHGVIYRKEITGGILFHSNGWGGSFNYAKFKTGTSVRVFSLQMVNMKHPKETKIDGNSLDVYGKPYVYGKINSFYILRPAFGNRKYWFEKRRKSGVSVGYNWALGPALGLKKPIYVEVVDTHHGELLNEHLIERYQPEVHHHMTVWGKASGLLGWGEVKLVPGAHVRGGLTFEYASRKEGIKSLEVGMALDAFPQKIDILYIGEQSQFFAKFYINLLLGKKYFR